MTPTARNLAEQLQASLYDQLVGHSQAYGLFSAMGQDQSIADELVKEASRLCGMLQLEKDFKKLKNQIDIVRTKVLVAATTNLVGEDSAEEACDMLERIKEAAKNE